MRDVQGSMPEMRVFALAGFGAQILLAIPLPFAHKDDRTSLPKMRLPKSVKRDFLRALPL